MKIAFISPNMRSLFDKSSNTNFGGAEVQQKLLADGLAGMGHDISFLVRNDKGFTPSNKKSNYSFYPFNLNSFGGNKINLISDFFSLASAMSKADADLYIMKLPRLLLLPVTLISKIISKKVIFWLSHDRDVNYLSNPSLKIGLLPYTIGLRLTDSIIAQTSYQNKVLKEKALKSSLIRSIVNVNNKYDDKDDINNKSYILWVGRYDKNNLKRVHIVFYIAKKLPHLDFKIACQTDHIGRFHSLEIKAKEFDNVEFLGKVEYDKISNYFINSQALLCTSMAEGFPNTYLQSWASSRPVFSLKINPDNIISDKNLGFSSNDDLSSFIKSIKIYLEDEKRLSKIGNNCVTYVKKEHSIQSLIPKYIQLLENTINE